MPAILASRVRQFKPELNEQLMAPELLIAIECELAVSAF